MMNPVTSRFSILNCGLVTHSLIRTQRLNDEGGPTCGVGHVILRWEQRVRHVVVRGHDALGGGGARPVQVSFPVPLAFPFPLSVCDSSSLLLPVPVVGRFVDHGGGFALVLAGVLMQDIQSFGVCCRFSDSRACTRLLAAFLTSYFTTVRGKWIRSR